MLVVAQFPIQGHIFTRKEYLEILRADAQCWVERPSCGSWLLAEAR